MEQPNSIVEDLTCFNIDLITVYDAILEGRQTQQKLVFVCESVVKNKKNGETSGPQQKIVFIITLYLPAKMAS